MSLLRIRNLQKSLGGKSVISDITISIEPGEVRTIIGPSGGGKSTLLKCINLLLIPDSGCIYFNDNPVVSPGEDGQLVLGLLPSTLRQHIGMVFQDWNLWPNLTVRQNIALAPRRVLGLSRLEANDLAADWGARVRMSESFEAYPHQLSGGQKQRVAIARALAMRPTILMLDEITSALDPILAAEILDIVLDLKEGGRTLIIVSHHIEFARAISDKVSFLHGGRIHEEGSTDILDNPQTPELKWFLQRTQTTR